MSLLWYVMTYTSLAGVVILSSLGAGLGGGLASIAALQAMSRAPLARASLMRALILGLALIETGAIIGVVMAILLLRTPLEQNFIPVALAQVGIMLALGIAALVVGIGGARGVSQAMYAISRQPFFASKIINIMLLTQSIIQTPLIFAFFISFIIYAQLPHLETMVQASALLAGGLCMGLGSIGPSLGLSRFARAAAQALAVNREIYSRILPFAFMSQAIIETPLIFALLSSMIIVLAPGQAEGVLTIVAAFSAAFVTGIGTLSPGLSSGKTAAAACQQMAVSPESVTTLSRLSILVQGLIDTSAIYALMISIFILIMR
jgi:F-type H+-transporting ATPase subunit c